MTTGIAETDPLSSLRELEMEAIEQSVLNEHVSTMAFHNKTCVCSTKAKRIMT